MQYHEHAVQLADHPVNVAHTHALLPQDSTAAFTSTVWLESNSSNHGYLTGIKLLKIATNTSFGLLVSSQAD